MEPARKSGGREAKKIEEDSGKEFEKPYQDGKGAKKWEDTGGREAKADGTADDNDEDEDGKRNEENEVVLCCAEYLCNHWVRELTGCLFCSRRHNFDALQLRSCCEGWPAVPWRYCRSYYRHYVLDAPHACGERSRSVVLRLTARNTILYFPWVLATLSSYLSERS